ncbi:hypothetical protein [Pseudomonas putida]|uniref:hypothetical protein n=1 Tax=Pseudomonas putida TaxID=303 RepID=UPI000E6B2B40|nr:hypothetical protein [Pseudomonas putida]RIZ40728.1 hypothetical protein CIK02_14045 [Pseudomonas putida]
MKYRGIEYKPEHSAPRLVVITDREIGLIVGVGIYHNKSLAMLEHTDKPGQKTQSFDPKDHRFKFEYQELDVLIRDDDATPGDDTQKSRDLGLGDSEDDRE